MVYTLKMRRMHGVLAILFGVFAASLLLGLANDATLHGALRAAIKVATAGFILFFVVMGVLGMAFPPSVIRADSSGLTLYSTILRLPFVSIPWREVASIAVVLGSIPRRGGEPPVERAMLVIRTTTPGGRTKGRVNSSIVNFRSAIQDAVSVDLSDPQSVVWLLPFHVDAVTVGKKLDAVRTRAERNKGIRRDCDSATT